MMKHAAGRKRIVVCTLLCCLSAASCGGAGESATARTTEANSSSSRRLAAPMRAANAAARMWIVRTEQVVRGLRPTPPAQARMYAAVASIFADVLALSPTSTASVAQANAATAAVLRHLLAGRADQFSKQLGADEKHAALSDESKALVDSYTARLDADVDVDVHTGTIPADLPAGSWVRTSKDGPFDPAAGSWSHWLLSNTDPGEGLAATVPAPPAVGSPEYEAQLSAVRDAVEQRDARWIAAINRWGGAPGTQGPAGIWLDRFVDELGESAIGSDPNFVQNQAILAKTLADAFIVTWDVKYQYWTQRPDMADPTITTAMPDPLFPSYVSGHSTVSSAAATVLGALYPKHASVFLQNAAEARDSRLYAGIHFPVDNEEGFALGTRIGDQVIARLGITSEGRPTEKVAVAATRSAPAADGTGTTPLVIERYKHSGAMDTSAADSDTLHAALVRVTNKDLGVGFLFGVEGGVLPALRYQPGWTAETVSTDPTWTPAACGGSPNVLVGGRYEATVEYRYPKPGEQAQTFVRVFDIKENNFFNVASDTDGLPPVVAVLARGNKLWVLRSTVGAAFVQLIDFAANIVTSSPLPGIGTNAHLRLTDGRGNSGLALKDLSDVLVATEMGSGAARFATIGNDGTVSAWKELTPEMEWTDNDRTQAMPLGPELQVRLVRSDPVTQRSDYEILDLDGKRLRLLDGVAQPQFRGMANGFAVIEFINDDTTHGILRMQEMFLNTKTGEWHRVFDLGAEIPESQVPEQYREYDATIFVAGAIEL